MKKIIILILLLSVLAIISYGQNMEEKVNSLMKQLTLEEKVSLVSGTGFATQPIPRLGIPEIKMTDGPIGVRWGKSTAFPAGIMLAAGWNTGLISLIGTALAKETKAHDRNMLLGPCINISRVPMNGRNFESYGEDPYLTGRLTVEYVKSLQKEKVIPSVKHYAANNQEFERLSIDEKIDERTLREIYLPAFEAAVKEADAWTVMAAYNKVNGWFCSENDHLLNDILKNEWGFNGFVVSDWGAVHNTLNPPMNGLDLEMPTGQYLGKDLLEAVKAGKITENNINNMVRRLLKVMFVAGLFEPKSDKGVLNTKEHQELALKSAEEGIVLLKNEKNILPLDLNKIKSIAVIGPNAAVNRAVGGGSAMVDPFYAVSPLDGLTSKLNNKIKINFAQGCYMDGDISPIEGKYFFTVLDGKKVNGLKGEYFNNKELKGNPELIRIDENIDFHWGGGSPSEKINIDNFSVRWTGNLAVDTSGEYDITTLSDDGVRLYINGEMVIDFWSDHGAETKTTKRNLEAGKEYKLKIEYYENAGDAVMKLGWLKHIGNLSEKAVEAAKNSDVVIFFGGNSYRQESEGFDRVELGLPQKQIELINKISDVNKNIIVVLNNGGPILMDEWLNNAKGIVEAWFPGEQGGNAIADVLIGITNPSGKLPVTFPKRWEDCSAFDSYPGKEGLTTYSDGIFVGYRHFEKNKIKPLFPFGYGLSYTTFEYSNLSISGKIDDGKIKVNMDVKNTGVREGVEIVQIYVRDVESVIERPVKELKGFGKVFLKTGEKKNITFSLDKRSFSYYDVTKKGWVMDSGDFEILIGASSEDIRLKGIYKY